MADSERRDQRADNGAAGSASNSTDIIDDAIRLVDTLQRKLVVAGVRRGVSAATSAPGQGDVWEEAVKEESQRDEPPLDQLMGIARSAAPEVAGHLSRAGASLLGALGESWQVLERSMRESGQQRPRSSEAPELPEGK